MAVDKIFKTLRAAKKITGTLSKDKPKKNKQGNTIIDEKTEMENAAKRYYQELGVPVPQPRKISKLEQKIGEDPQVLGMAYGPMGVALVGADEYGDSVTRNIKSAKGKRDKTATFMKRSKKKQQKEEFLTGGQARIDANKDGEITGEDFELLKKNKKRFGGMAIKGVKENPPIY
jgi:hypothetical protein